MNEEQYEYLGMISVNYEEVHMGRDEDYLYSGIVTNLGFCEQDKYKIDSDISIDQNISDFVEFMEEKNDDC